MDTEQAAYIVSSFIATYYGNFVRENIHTILEMYSDASSTTVAKLNESVATVNRGKHEIRQYLERLNAELGPRKVHITTADSIPTTDGSILVSVGGQVHTRLAAQTFTQSFVLSPTKHRARTLFIAAESLRFVAFDPEVIPQGAVIVAPGEEDIIPVEPEVVPVAPTPAVEKAPRPPRERKPREPREPKAPKKEEAAPAAAAPVAAAAPPAAAEAAPVARREPRERKERAPREKKPEQPEAAKPPVAAAESSNATEAKKPERAQTATVRLHQVPKTIRLSVVTAAVGKFGEVVDARWFGADSADCLVDFATPVSAAHLVFSKTFAIEGLTLKRSFFFTNPKPAAK